MPNQESSRTATGIAEAIGAGAPSAEAVVLGILSAAVRGGAEPEMTFGELGGDSLRATQVLARVWQELDVRLPLSSLAPDTEIGAFVTRIEERLAAREACDSVHENAPPAEGSPGAEALTPGQVAILLSAELSGAAGAAAATLPVVLRLRGALDPFALRDAIAAIVHRHQALSLSIADLGQGLTQRQRRVAPVELPSIDAGSGQLEVAREHVRLRIDPAEPPLLRPLLIRVGPAEHILVLAIHHAACDGWSVGILLRELPEFYESALTGGDPPDLEPAPGFLDFARWQRDLLFREEHGLAAFWRSTLQPLPDDRWLPTDFARPNLRRGEGNVEHLAVDPRLLADLRSFAAEQRITTFMALLAAYAMVLADFADVTELIVGVPMANRPHPALAATVGYLSNTVPVRVNLAGEPTVRELVGRVRRGSLDAYDHQSLPLPNLISALSPERDVNVPPVFQVCLVYNEMQPSPMRGLDVKPMLLHKGSSPYDLTLYLEQRLGSLDGYLEYPTDLFQPATVRELRGRLIRVLTGIAANPDAGALELAAEACENP